jgi:hypothetical protein
LIPLCIKLTIFSLLCMTIPPWLLIKLPFFFFFNCYYSFIKGNNHYFILGVWVFLFYFTVFTFTFMYTLFGQNCFLFNYYACKLSWHTCFILILVFKIIITQMYYVTVYLQFNDSFGNKKNFNKSGLCDES